MAALLLLRGGAASDDEVTATPPGSRVDAPPTSLPSDAERGDALRRPSGAPPGISCEDALSISSFLEQELATPVIAPLPRELSALWGSMLDPHGFWSASPDSPVAEALSAEAEAMLASLRDRVPGCAGARRVAAIWQPWQVSLAGAFDAAFSAESGRAHSAREVFELAAEPIFEDDPVRRTGVELARELGRRLGAFASRFPAQRELVYEARGRYLPLDEAVLAEIATLSALRAYVPLVDPHGDFAPFDEEWSLYAGDETLDAGSPLWADVTRTPLGARVVADPTPPLQVDDLVLSIDGLSLAGATVDQIEQAARSEPEGGSFRLEVLRQGEPAPLSLEVPLAAASRPGELELEHIEYGGQRRVLRIAIHDVGDELGVELADVLEREGSRAAALLLDLRGNGGGSLDAAVDALGLFLPGARLFPLIHRGSVTELVEAPRRQPSYAGPLAVLVDGDTASAAEMLAGAVQAYERGVLIGSRTFGKGCVQEYFGAVVPSGVLRMTTLQFVMPSGKALQQIGLTPDLALKLAPALERESELARQPITYAGPDVRDRRVPAGPPWPRLIGSPGPCQEALVCSALSRLSGVRPGASSGARATRPRAGSR